MLHSAEARLAAVRIVSNYARLFISVALGLYLARVLLVTVGNDGFALFALLGSTTGFTLIIEQVAGWSMIREIGAAYHRGSDASFRRMFNSAVVVCIGGALLTLVIFAILWACLPLMQVSEALLPAARIFVIAKAVEMAVVVLLTPQFNMYLIAERMVAYNFWLIIRRATVVLAALSLFWLNNGGTVERGLMIFAWVWSALMVCVMIVSSALIMRRDPRLLPHPLQASRAGVKSILTISGWNLATQSAVTLTIPAGSIIMNLAFGLFGNLIFGFATRLGGYARMLVSGMTVGLDAVAARLSTVDRHRSIRDLLRYSTALHALVAFPAVIGFGMLAEPLLEIWIGNQIENPADAIPEIAVLTRIMLLGFLGMCMADGWTRLLYGAGHIRRYAKFVIAANAAAPVIAFAYLYVLPEEIRYTAVAMAFATVYLGLYGLVMPRRLAAAFDVPLVEVVQPLLRPMLVSIACSPVLLFFLESVERWNLAWASAAIVCYMIAYAALGWFFAMPRDDRDRLAGALWRWRLKPSLNAMVD